MGSDNEHTPLNLSITSAFGLFHLLSVKSVTKVEAVELRRISHIKMLLYLRFPETPAGRRSDIGTRCLSPPHGPPCLAAAQRTDEDRLRPGLHFEMRGADRSAPTDRPSSICQTARSLSLSLSLCRPAAAAAAAVSDRESRIWHPATESKTR